MGLKVALSNLVSGKSSELNGSRKSSSSLLQSIKTDTNSKQTNQVMMNLTQKVTGETAQKKDLTAGDFLKIVLAKQPVPINDANKSKLPLTTKANKAPEKMTLEDYNFSFRRAVYDKAMSGLKLTDQEIREADKALANAGLYKSIYNRQGTVESFREMQKSQGKELTVLAGKENIEYANRAGQAVLQYQEYRAKQTDAAIERGQNYVNEALGGFVQPIVNAPINIINGVSEPFRAGERALFGTSNIPEVPRMTVAERSEYWNKDGRQVINRGAEIGATIALGGAAGGKAIGTQAGRIFLGTESAYNIGAGIAGKDITQTDERGNARQMPIWERGVRIGGGMFGARQTTNTEIAALNSAVNKLDDIFTNPPKTQTEMVTPEGMRVRVPQQKTPLEKMGEPLEISISSDKANAPYVKKGDNPPYGGTRAQEIILKRNTVFVRVHGPINQRGVWLMRKKDVEGLTALQIKDKFALPRIPTHISEVNVPAGTKLTVGNVAPQIDWGKGGSTQYELEYTLPASAYKNLKELR